LRAAGKKLFALSTLPDAVTPAATCVGSMPARWASFGSRSFRDCEGEVREVEAASGDAVHVEDRHAAGFDVDGEADAIAACVEAEVRGYAFNVAFAVLGEAYDGPVDDHGLVRVQRVERGERGVVSCDAELHRPAGPGGMGGLPPS
jgi:hypothetical protein